jgi:2'-5' RNA ligase
MKRFIGIVPPKEIYDKIQQIQNEYGDNRLEPHITIIAPVTVVDETKWMETIERICADFSAIDISLPATGYFGKKTLFIDVASPKLSNLYHQLNNHLKAYQKNEPNAIKNTTYHPHLTLGRAWCGFTKDDFSNMKHLAEEYLSKEKISFKASSIRVYHKPSPKGRYEQLKDIFLKED